MSSGTAAVLYLCYGMLMLFLARRTFAMVQDLRGVSALTAARVSAGSPRLENSRGSLVGVGEALMKLKRRRLAENV